MNSPLVSVVIPCHYSKNDIALAVGSVAKQTYSNIEVILMSDDGDDYRESVATFSQNLPIVFGSSGGKSTGRSNANNIAMTLCKGQVVLILDSDDFLDADFFEKIVPRVISEGACLVPRRPVDYNDYTPLATRGIRKLGEYTNRTKLTTRDYIHLPFGWQTVYRKDLLIYPWETSLSLDPDFILECSLFDRIGYAPFECYQGYNYRVRPGSICHSENSHQLVIDEYVTMIARLNNDEDGLRLKPQTRKDMAQLLEGRIKNVHRFLADRDKGELKYEPLIIGDMLMYPLQA